MRPPLSTAALLAAMLASGGSTRVLSVGPGKTYAKPSEAAKAARDGDTVEMEAVTYAGDAATWDADNLVLRGTRAYAHLRADGVNAGGKGTWVIRGKNAWIENVEFSGAKVPDENGAGIRQEGDNVTIRHCYFHDNENGILTGAGPGSIVIESCEFAANGFGDGYTHNMYIGGVASFTLRGSYSHHAKIGHNVKSRAQKNFILYNRIMDEADGTSSYDLDLPNGGFSVVVGNLFQQGPQTDNPALFAYGAEGLSNSVNELYLVNNTFVNDRGSGTHVTLAGGAAAKLFNNLFTGGGPAFSGPADTAGNVVVANAGFVDRAGFDYRLTAASPALDKGKDPGRAGDFELRPVSEYLHPLSLRPRPAAGALDAGACEYSLNNALRPGREAGKGPGVRLFWRDPVLGWTLWDARSGMSGDFDAAGRQLLPALP